MSTPIWEGIEIAFTHHKQRLGGPFDHLELWASPRGVRARMAEWRSA